MICAVRGCRATASLRQRTVCERHRYYQFRCDECRRNVTPRLDYRRNPRRLYPLLQEPLGDFGVHHFFGYHCICLWCINRWYRFCRVDSYHRPHHRRFVSCPDCGASTGTMRPRRERKSFKAKCAPSREALKNMRTTLMKGGKDRAKSKSRGQHHSV